MSETTKIAGTANTDRVTTSESWFLLEGRKDKEYFPVPATIQTLINGEAAFDMLYEKILHAQSSVDIIIWGFQPSMFFRRKPYKDPKTGVATEPMCIGDLLIKKALDDKVQVKLLAWSMWFGVQTLKEANLGNMPGVWKNSAGVGVTEEQMFYDEWWYKTVMRETTPLEINAFIHRERHRLNLFRTESNEAYGRLFRFCKTGNLNLQVKKRNVAIWGRTANSDDIIRGGAFLISATHHQKTALIDYMQPENAVGFVLEHNMLDNYWDTNQHVVTQATPNTGKNYIGNYQDVSSMVSGQVLWHINHNFCQSWDRWTNVILPSLSDSEAQEKYKEKLTEQRSGIKREAFKPGDFGTATMAQILRTYDAPDVEDIKTMYLQNIKKATRYVYTENQYFRWPKLVEEFTNNWKKMKAWARKEPIYWFVITNSSDEGVESGSASMNEMLKLLGRQDVMPNVALAVENTDLSYKIKNKKIILADEEARPYLSEEQIQQYETELDELEKQKAELDKIANEVKTNPKILYKDLSETTGIKAHICTIVAKDEWKEVYVHSKVTVIDDTFMFIGSANLNRRSMHLDTELGIITECKQLSQDLRQQLWGWHTGNDSEANPPQLQTHKDVEKAFKRWAYLIGQNRTQKNNMDKGLKPLHPLCEFLRMSPVVSYKD